MRIAVTFPFGICHTQTQECLQVVGNTITKISVTLLHFNAVKTEMLFLGLDADKSSAGKVINR
ncbi:hypothetical protein ES703_110866 [subsurface metagenome]